MITGNIYFGGIGEYFIVVSEVRKDMTCERIWLSLEAECTTWIMVSSYAKNVITNIFQGEL